MKGTNFKPTATLKDLNLLHLNRERRWLHFKAADRRKVFESLKEDVMLLKNFNMMDYSLLFCVQKNPNPVEEFQGNRYTYLSECGKYIYRLGIIDYLQDFNARKHVEYFGRVRVLQEGK